MEVEWMRRRGGWGRGGRWPDDRKNDSMAAGMKGRGEWRQVGRESWQVENRTAQFTRNAQGTNPAFSFSPHLRPSSTQNGEKEEGMPQYGGWILRLRRWALGGIGNGGKEEKYVVSRCHGRMQRDIYKNTRLQTKRQQTVQKATERKQSSVPLRRETKRTHLSMTSHWNLAF